MCVYVEQVHKRNWCLQGVTGTLLLHLAFQRKSKITKKHVEKSAPKKKSDNGQE